MLSPDKSWWQLSFCPPQAFFRKPLTFNGSSRCECSVNSWEVWFHRLLALSERWGLRTGGLGETPASKRHQQVEGRQQGGGRPIEKDGKPSQVWTQSRRWQWTRIRTEERRTESAGPVFVPSDGLGAKGRASNVGNLCWNCHCYRTAGLFDAEADLGWVSLYCFVLF